MPLYEYQCQACKQPFTLLRKSEEKDEAASCPACGAKDAKRQITAFGLGGGGGGVSNLPPRRSSGFS